MKFLVDAQLPARLARTAELSDDQGRVVVTKDRDFRDGRLLSRPPSGSWWSLLATSPTLRCSRCSRRTRLALADLLVMGLTELS